ncbi:MAG: hypothetical protein HFG75_04595 [Hungatella sp.]|nr:hypothetical protein [Hungatella sp.]
MAFLRDRGLLRRSRARVCRHTGGQAREGTVHCTQGKRGGSGIKNCPAMKRPDSSADSTGS